MRQSWRFSGCHSSRLRLQPTFPTLSNIIQHLTHWIGGDEPGGVLEEGTDLWAVEHNYVSVTPIPLDLTDHALIEKVKGWDLKTWIGKIHPMCYNR